MMLLQLILIKNLPTQCIIYCFLALLTLGCSGSEVLIEPDTEEHSEEEVVDESELVEGVDYFLPNIDLSNWKVTLPIGNPSEIKPPEILDYANNPLLKEFMYNDSIDGSLVFYTYPGSTTTNSKYSRTELREQMVPGSNHTNWTFAQGGRIKGTLAVPEMSKDASGKYHRAMVMQIHGRLTDAQRDLIGEDDNNAPPILKIYWQNEKVRVVTKKLKDPNVDDVDLLRTSAWTDNNEHYFSRVVKDEQFTLEVVASEGKIKVTLDDDESVTIENNDLMRYGVFENYFKAGNYLNTTDEGSFSKVKYYDLVVSH